ncbi:MAG: hypothetical protein ACOYOU_02120 [Kiritimatiellia bacterium]
MTTIDCRANFDVAFMGIIGVSFAAELTTTDLDVLITDLQAPAAERERFRNTDAQIITI